jgi:sortase A
MMKKSKRSLILIIAGLLLIAAALILFLSNAAEDHAARDSSERIVAELIEKIDEQEDPAQYPTDNPKRMMPVMTVEERKYAGVLTIPELDLELPVAASFDYDTLRSTPCRYSGNVYGGNMVIAAHNYDAHFGRINALLPGSTVYFTDTEDHRYAYEVYSVETLNPDQEPELTRTDDRIRELTLFTCTYSGAARVTVRCKGVAA